MSQTTLIIVNATLGVAVTYGLIWLLAVGISRDRRLRDQQVRQFRRPTDRRLAA